MIDFIMRSIPRRIQASLTGIYLVTYIATALVVYLGARTAILDANTATLTQRADLSYQKLVDTISVLSTNLTAWSALEVMNDIASGDIDKRIARAVGDLKRLYNLEGNIYAFNEAGELLATTVPAENGQWPQLPATWRLQGRSIAILDKNIDPISGDEVIVLGIPVFGTFDRDFRLGTLLVTYPWKAVEKQLVDPEGTTLLVERGSQTKLLAADAVGERYYRAGLDNRIGALIVGRSHPQSGPLVTWQVVSIEQSGKAFTPLHRVAVALLLLGIGLAVPIAILGRWLSHRLTAPIADLTRTAQQISDTDNLGTRVLVSSSDELGALARSFNRMTDSLEKARRDRELVLVEIATLNHSLEAKIAARTRELETAMTAQQRLIGDISHEIKSPLARLSVALGLARRVEAADTGRQFDRMEKEIQNISTLAGELLTLARLSNSPATSSFSQMNLSDVVRQVVDDAIYESPQRAPDMTLYIDAAGAFVKGDPELLRRSVENVVRNAIFYTAKGTPIHVTVERRTADVISVEVKDCGPGVPPDALPHLFEPFYRVDEARARDTGGSGIGLAICERAIHLHGGSVHARNNIPQGLVVEIQLPEA